VVRKTKFVAGIMAVLLLANCARAGVSVIMNGSFEENAPIDDISQEAPADWSDVNVPTAKFGGYVGEDWQTDGGYSLTLYSKWLAKCDAGDKAIVSQQVYLTDAMVDVNQIIFDIKLSASYGDWDANKRSALVLMDGEVIWNSDILGPSDYGDGVYQDVVIGGIDINDANSHVLSLAICSDVNETSSPYIDYRAQWDFVRFDAHCEGAGYLRADITGPDGRRDCYVDEFDLALLAQKWLEEDPAYRYDLFEDDDNIVNFRDFAVLAASWISDSFGQENQLLSSDLNYDGIVNLLDFAVLAENYSKELADYEDVYKMSEQWLQKDWLYWPQ
jgi:hypothetical protein